MNEENLALKKIADMVTETKTVSIKLTRNYSSFGSEVTKVICYNTKEGRDELVARMYAECRRDVKIQMELGQ